MGYRVSMTALVTPDHPQYAAAGELVAPHRRRPDGYGLALVESDRHAALYVGTVEQIRAWRAERARRRPVLDCSPGYCYPLWPHREAAADLIARPGPGDDQPRAVGRRLVATLTHPDGGQIVIYRYLDRRVGREMVGWHCGRCHPQPHLEPGCALTESGPGAVNWIVARARRHLQDWPARCRPIAPRIEQLATAVANALDGSDRPTVSAASWCATTGPCSVIRHLRAQEATTRRGCSARDHLVPPSGHISTHTGGQA